MKRKTILVYALLSVLIASMAGLENVNVSNANPIVNVPSTTDQPIVSLVSPINGTILQAQQNETIIFNVAMPQSWYSGVFSEGTIRNVSCILDQEQILFNDTIYGRDAPVTERAGWVYFPPANAYVRSINYSQNVGLLPAGLHILKISVAADTWSRSQYVERYQDNSAVVTYSFMVSAPPTITLLPVENSSYNGTIFPLVFNVNATTSWSGYSLDNQANVTTNGNATLTDLAEGNHSLVVYANDTFGNMGKSDTILFNVILPTPTPSSTPSPSPTQKPTLEISPTPTTNYYSDWIPYIALTVVVALSVSALVYFKKRKK